MSLESGMVTWAGQEKFKRKEIVAGEAIVSLLSMTTHTGTHVDAPKHFLGRKAGSVDKLDLSKLIGPCEVIELPPHLSSPSRGEGWEGIFRRLNKGDRVLFKTSNSRRRLLEKKNFVTDYVSLNLEQAKLLAAKKIALVGVDYLGVEAKGSQGRGHPVHKTLLKAGIVVVEGLNLSKIKPGHYNLAVLPLKIVNGDGAPARAILYK